MATTANSTAPMRAYGGRGTQATQVVNFRSQDASIALGDVLVFSTEDVDEDNSAPAEKAIIGVATEDVATTGDLLPVALALPGVMFSANIISAAATDETGVLTANVGVTHGIDESDTDGYACIDISNTTQNVATTLFYDGAQMDPQTNTDTGPYTAGVGVTNPRVIFVFVSSIFADVT